MKAALVLLLVFCMLGIAPLAYSQERKPSLPMPPAKLDPIDMMEDEQLDLKVVEARFAAFSKHTQKYREILQQDREALINIGVQAKKDKQEAKMKELNIVLNDYNDLLGDLDLMLAIIDMREMIKPDSLLRYYDSQKVNHEKLKYGFSIKNELYLAKIDTLKDEQVRAFAVALLKNYRDYCVFDINLLHFNFDEKGNIKEGNKIPAGLMHKQVSK